MPRVKRQRFAATKRMINPNDERLAAAKRKKAGGGKAGGGAGSGGGGGGGGGAGGAASAARHVDAASSQLFFSYNRELGPPYHVLVDTNFINFSIQNKLDVFNAMLDCLYAKCTPYLTDCVMAELEKLGPKYRVALKIARDERFERLPCTHKGTYADDCLVRRVRQAKCYIVATCDRDLRRRIRRVPGVPIMYIKERKYSVERMPDAYGAPKL